MNFVYGAIGLVALAALAFWYRGQVYNQGFEAGQSEVKLEINRALDIERSKSRELADSIQASKAVEQTKLQAEIRSLRAIKDPTKCFVTNLPNDMFKQLHDDYERLSN